MSDLPITTGLDDIDELDVTVPLEPQRVWQPGPSLSARVEPRNARRPNERHRDPRIISLVILLAAIAIAVALWMAALWLRAADEPDVDPADETEATLTSLYDMGIGEFGAIEVPDA